MYQTFEQFFCPLYSVVSRSGNPKGMAFKEITNTKHKLKQMTVSSSDYLELSVKYLSYTKDQLLSSVSGNKLPLDIQTPNYINASQLR